MVIKLKGNYMMPRSLKVPLLIFFVIGVFLAGVFAVLLTPLKHVTLLTPTIYDVQAMDFYERYKSNPEKYIFIDVRPVEAYNRVHAEHSISMPLHTLYDEWRNLPKNTDKTIVLICNGGRSAGVGYHYLEHMGFFNLERIEGGIEQWQLDGLPVVSDITTLTN